MILAISSPNVDGTSNLHLIPLPNELFLLHDPVALEEFKQRSIAEVKKTSSLPRFVAVVGIYKEAIL